MQTESVDALALVTTDPLEERNVLEKIRGLHQCAEANLIFVPNDLYLKVEAESSTQL
jgi:hypothetical protein